MSIDLKSSQEDENRDYAVAYEMALAKFKEHLVPTEAVKAAREYVGQLKIGDQLNSDIQAELDQLHA